MSEVVRLTLVSHAMTDAMAAGRFPADEPLNTLGHSQIDAEGFATFERAFTAPETRARQTAERIGVHATPERRLADLDVGGWRGSSLDELPAEQLARWVARPDSAPHGGESLQALIARVRHWMDDISGTPGRVVAVTHPAVVRAAVLSALDAPPESFWRIDIEPASRTVMHCRRRWTVRWGQR